MMPLHHILAATDFSDASILAIERGFLLSQKINADYTIIHAIELDALAQWRQLFGEANEAIAASLRTDATKRLKQIVSDSSPANAAAHMALVDGFPTAEIPAYAKANGVDLILVGAYGGDLLRKLPFGTTASKLLRKSPCPVLVVKNKSSEAYKRTLLAIDFSSASETAIRLAQQIAPDAELVLMHVIDLPFEGKMRYAGVSENVIAKYRVHALSLATQQMGKLAASVKLSAADYAERIVQGEITDSLLSYSKKMACDLIVVGKHGTHVTEELLLGSVTKHVLADCNCDILVVIEHSEPGTL